MSRFPLAIQFDICPLKFSTLEFPSSSTITQTEAMQSASLGLVSGSACRCKHCKHSDAPARNHGEAVTLGATRDILVLTNLHNSLFLVNIGTLVTNLLENI